MELAPDIDRLGQIVFNAVAPSFFPGAVAAFLSLMMLRLADVNGHIKATLVHRPCVSLATSHEQISRSALNLRSIHQDIERTVQQNGADDPPLHDAGDQPDLAQNLTNSGKQKLKRDQ